MEEITSLRSVSYSNNRMESEGIAMIRRIQAEVTSMKRASEERGNQDYNTLNLTNYPDIRPFFESMLEDQGSSQDNSKNCSERM